MIAALKNRFLGWFERYMMKREDRLKGPNHEYSFCNKCHYVHEYRTHEKKVFVRCRSCRHVYLKRDMTAREHTDMLNYEINEAISTAKKALPARNGANNMVNDGKKFLSNKERVAYIRYCENMTQYYREDKFIQFHLLDDFELMQYVDVYKYDEATPSPLDEVCDGKGGK